MATKFITKKGDTGQPLIAILKDSHGQAVDLTGWTVVFTMTPEDSNTPKINQASCTILNQTTNKGKVQYDWQASDVDTVGNFNCEFLGTNPTGGTVTFPRGLGTSQFGKVVVVQGLS